MRINGFLTTLAGAILIFGSIATANPITLTEEALQLQRESLLIDGHNDLPWTLRDAGDSGLTRYNLNEYTEDFNTDIPRLRQGGMGAQFWSVYVPVETMDNGTAFSTTKQQIDLVHRMIRKYPDTFELALSTVDIRRIHAAGKIASMIGAEGGHSIENSLDKLRELYALGTRYMTLTHSRSLSWADSCTGDEITGGLSDFGKQVVAEMNRLGMLVDISHVSAKTMRAVLAETKAPVIFSHSSAYAVRQHVRNVPDDVLLKVKTNGGVVMVNFYTDFISSSDRADVDTLLNHIDHIVQIAGIDHVGLGSDFDGVPSLPFQLEDVSKYPYITQGLLNRGYSKDDIKKVLGENLMRVFEETERVAGGLISKAEKSNSKRKI